MVSQHASGGACWRVHKCTAMDPGLVGPELLAGFAGPTSVGAFLPLCPSPMLRPDTRASKSRYKIIDTIGSHQKSYELVQQARVLLHGAVRAVFGCHHVLK